MCVDAPPGDAEGMTNESGNSPRRWIWIGAAAVLTAVAVVGRDLIRSGTVTVGFLTHWYGQAALGAVFIAAALAAWWLFERAYRR